MHLPKSVKVLLVDNDGEFLQSLQQLLANMGVDQVAVAHDLISGLKTFHSFQPDLCLLDVHLGHQEWLGVDLGQKIRNLSPHVPLIFLSARHSTDSYEKCRNLVPSNFLSKEISVSTLYQTLDLALLLQQRYVRPDGIQAAQTKPLLKQNIFFKIGDVYKSVPVDRVTYFHAERKLTYARVGHRSYPTSMHLKALEEEFAHIFVRIHKTYLVNASLIDFINPKEGIVSIGSETLPIGNTYRRDFLMGLKLLK
jgi:DNA-binding LytR/AlgR family response regulator